MSNPIGMATHLASNAVRVGWYLGANRLVDRRVKAAGGSIDVSPKRPVPTRAALLKSLRALLLQDAQAVFRGRAAARPLKPTELADYISRFRAMLADLPEATERRMARKADTVDAYRAPDDGLPDYFAQDFHFQSGGHLSDESARLYDVQVDTLFYGSAGAMRRAALEPISREMDGLDQRKVSLLDVACGTGRFLRDVRLVYPAIQLSGADLSDAYLREAQVHMTGLRSANLSRANVETMPFDAAQHDLATCIFLFHELPPAIRPVVAREIARVVKPGGLFVFVDSLQIGDRPDWDGLVELFPVRFHEPYYRHYAQDDLTTLFTDAGFELIDQRLVFVSKMMAFRRL